MYKKRNKQPVIRTDGQDDLSPAEQAALAMLRVQRGEEPVQHYDVIPNVKIKLEKPGKHEPIRK